MNPKEYYEINSKPFSFVEGMDWKPLQRPGGQSEI